MRAIREPTLLAFSTASSEAAYPLLLERLDAFGIPLRIVSFVLPLGYSFNLDGSMMYCTFAVLFIAQAYGIHVRLASAGDDAPGAAGDVQGNRRRTACRLGGHRLHAGLFQTARGGLLLVLAVDHLLDMGRSATNVIGNSVAAVIVAKWEGVAPVQGPTAPSRAAAAASDYDRPHALRYSLVITNSR